MSKLLGLPHLRASDLQGTEEQQNAHRQQIILYLSRRLADVGRIQQEQQEIRVNRQLERQNMSSIASELVHTHAKGGKAGVRPVADEGGGVPDIFVPAPIASAMAQNGDAGNDDEDEPIESVLTASQIQQFESESSQLLQEATSQLAAIEKAQTSLLEISNLQSELAVHLTQQMELTDKLWEDSVLVSGRVDEGNKQLRKARERNKEGRIWLLVFLIGSSLSLLCVFHSQAFNIERLRLYHLSL